jgi:FkbM family methyltransferase
MRLDSVARKYLSPKLRQSVGCWSLNVVSHNEWMLQTYIKLLHGYRADNLTVEKGCTVYNYLDRVIKAPVNAAGVFLEIFVDDVYDGVPLRKGDVAIDVGAYVGMWSVKAAIAVGRNGKVVAVEPSDENRKWLVGNIEGLPVAVVPVVVSDKNGTEKFYVSNVTSCNSIVYKQSKSIELPSRTIDQIVVDEHLPHVDFIKVDAEGAELKVLRGAIETLKGNNVRLAIASYHETAEGVPEVDEVVRLLNGLGYRTWHTDGLRRYTYAEK